jgi:hypothetical protein
VVHAIPKIKRVADGSDCPTGRAEQESALLAPFNRVVLLLDGDAAGRAASCTITARLSRRCWVAEIQVPDGAQPDQLSLEAIQELLS